MMPTPEYAALVQANLRLAQKNEAIETAFLERLDEYDANFGIFYEGIQLPDRFTHTVRMDSQNGRFISVGMNIDDEGCQFVNWLDEGQSPNQDYWFHGRPQYDGLIDVPDFSKLRLHGDIAQLHSNCPGNSIIALGLFDDEDLASKVIDTVFPHIVDLPEKTRQYLVDNYSA